MSEADVTVARAFTDLATLSIVQHRASIEAQRVNEQLSAALASRVVIEQADGRARRARRRRPGRGLLPAAGLRPRQQPAAHRCRPGDHSRHPRSAGVSRLPRRKRLGRLIAVYVGSQGRGQVLAWRSPFLTVSADVRWPKFAATLAAEAKIPARAVPVVAEPGFVYRQALQAARPIWLHPRSASIEVAQSRPCGEPPRSQRAASMRARPSWCSRSGRDARATRWRWSILISALSVRLARAGLSSSRAAAKD